MLDHVKSGYGSNQQTKNQARVKVKYIVVFNWMLFFFLLLIDKS